MKKILLSLTLFLSFAVLYAADFAYIAKQDGLTVYIDITELKTKPKKGDIFKLVEKEESLKNHKGEDLGTVFTYGGVFTITEVQPKFAVGTLKEKYASKSAQKAVLFEEAAAPVVQPVTAEKADAKTPALFRSTPINDILISARMADVYGDGKKLVALNEKNEIKVFSLEDKTFKEVETLRLPSSRKAFYLSAFDAKKSGADQLFIVVQDVKAETINTLVIEAKDGKLKQTQSLRWAVATADEPQGRKLYSQEIYKHNGLKTGPVRELLYNNKFEVSKEKLPASAEASVFAFLNFNVDEDNEKDTLLTMPSGSLYMYPAEGKRVDFGSDYSFAAAPKRIVINNVFYKILPPIAAFNDGGKNTVVALENIPKIAILSDSFASFKGTKVRYFRYNEMAFEEVRVIELPAIAFDMSYGELAGHKGIIMPLVYENGKTVLELY